MKTFKLEREEGDESFAWTDNRGTCWEIICADKLSEIFNVPVSTKKLWLTIRKTPKKGWFKASTKDYCHLGLYLFFRKKKILHLS